MTDVKGEDATQADRTVAKDRANLKKRQRDLRTVLSIVGKCVSQGHYDAVVRHSTSMQWIFDMLRCDYDIQQKGIHFFNILDMKYDSSKLTPIAFYNQYRNLITNNLSRKNHVIKYKNNWSLPNDENNRGHFQGRCKYAPTHRGRGGKPKADKPEVDNKNPQDCDKIELLFTLCILSYISHSMHLIL